MAPMALTLQLPEIAQEHRRARTHTIARVPTLPSLTGLRFVAAAVVLASHFAPNSWLPFGTGPAAVVLFFLLSGFILTYTAPERLHVRAFYAARIARIYPAYLLGLLPMAVLAQTGALRPDVWCPAPHAALLPDLVLAQAWDPRVAICLNGPAWSVSCEMTFYALFPLLLPLARRCGLRASGHALLGIWLTALALPVLFLCSHPHGIDGAILYRLLRWSPAMHLLDFAAGMLLGRLWLAEVRLPRPGLCVPAVLLAMPVVASLVPSSMSFIPVQDALLWPPLAVLLLALAQGRSPLATILAAPLCVTLGEASYGLYILHWPLHLGLDRLGLLSPLAGGWPSFVAYAGLAVACALLSLALVEMPARRAVRRLLAGPPPAGSPGHTSPGVRQPGTWRRSAARKCRARCPIQPHLHRALNAALTRCSSIVPN